MVWMVGALPLSVVCFHVHRRTVQTHTHVYLHKTFHPQTQYQKEIQLSSDSAFKRTQEGTEKHFGAVKVLVKGNNLRLAVQEIE